MNLKLCSYCFNKDSNGGEAIILTTRIVDEHLIQEFNLNSYGNTASFNLGFELTPAKLREAADLLETALINHAVASP